VSNIIGNTFMNQGIGPGIIWVIMLEFFLLFLLSVWQKGLLTGPESSRGIEPEEEWETLNMDNCPQQPAQMVDLPVETGE